MTEKNEGADQNQPGENPKNSAKLKINGFYIKDLSFESPMVPAVFINQTEPPKLKMGVDINVAKIDGTAFEVALKINAEAVVNEDSLFLVELVHAGIFVLNPELEKEEMERTLLIECPNILFPYARKIVSDVTQDGGFAPLVLDPVNFEAIYEQKKESAGTKVAS